MQFLAWAFIGLLALIFMLFWMLFERRIPLTTIPSATLWFYWAWQSDTVTYGTTVVLQESYDMLFWIGVFFGLMNIVLLVMWLWVDEDEDIFRNL